MKKRAAPIIVAVLLLLLPALYVGSYFALAERVYFSATSLNGEERIFVAADYRIGGSRIGRAALVFWPLEQIDRKLRPGAWETDEVVP